MPSVCLSVCRHWSPLSLGTQFDRKCEQCISADCTKDARVMALASDRSPGPTRREGRASRSEIRCYYTHTHPFNGPLSGTTRVSRYQKGKTNLDFTEARDSEGQWHQLGRMQVMQVCTSLQIDNHASTSPLSLLQAGCPFCRPTNSVKALKAHKVLLYCGETGDDF